MREVISMREDYKEQLIFFFKMDAKESMFRIHYCQKYSIHIDNNFHRWNFWEFLILYPTFYEKSFILQNQILQMIERHLELNSKSNIGNAKLYLIMEYSMDQLLIN